MQKINQVIWLWCVSSLFIVRAALTCAVHWYRLYCFIQVHIVLFSLFFAFKVKHLWLWMMWFILLMVSLLQAAALSLFVPMKSFFYDNNNIWLSVCFSNKGKTVVCLYLFSSVLNSLAIPKIDKMGWSICKDPHLKLSIIYWHIIFNWRQQHKKNNAFWSTSLLKPAQDFKPSLAALSY